MATKPIMQACDDGWLPEKLAYLHPKYKTPIILISILYVIAVISIISGLDISILGNLSLISTNLIYLLINATLWKLPQIAPEEWKNSYFKVGPAFMKVIVVISSLAAIIKVYLNAIRLSMPLIIGNIVLVALGYIYAIWRIHSKKVHMEISYEKD